MERKGRRKRKKVKRGGDERGRKEAINWNLGMEERSAGRRANHRKLTKKKKKTSRIPTQDELSEEFQKTSPAYNQEEKKNKRVH